MMLKPGRPQELLRIDVAEREKEVEKTRRVIEDLLAEPRSHFPVVAVFFDGKEVPEHVADAAWAWALLEQQAARRAGARGFDVLAAMERHMPAELARERERVAQFRPVPMARNAYDSAYTQQVRDAPRLRLLNPPLVLTSASGQEG